MEFRNTYGYTARPDVGVKKKGEVRIIPVVFHVIHAYGDENISKAQIEDQIRILNEDFRRMNADTSNTRDVFKSRASDFEIEFQLARKDPDGNCTEGITRHYSAFTDKGDDPIKSMFPAWDQKKYLNIWVVRNITYSSQLGGTVLGYAYLT